MRASVEGTLESTCGAVSATDPCSKPVSLLPRLLLWSLPPRLFGLSLNFTDIGQCHLPIFVSGFLYLLLLPWYFLTLSSASILEYHPILGKRSNVSTHSPADDHLDFHGFRYCECCHDQHSRTFFWGQCSFLWRMGRSEIFVSVAPVMAPEIFHIQCPIHSMTFLEDLLRAWSTVVIAEALSPPGTCFLLQSLLTI